MSSPSVPPDAAPAPGPATPHSEHQWVFQVTALSLILGVMLALALRTTAHIRTSGLPDRGSSDLKAIRENKAQLEKERDSLRDEVAKLSNSVTNEKNNGTQLVEQIQEYRALMGYGAVQGPGLEITLQNSPVFLPGTESQADAYLLDVERDVKGVVNELWAAGAEAIAIKGKGEPGFQRFVVTSTIVKAPGGASINGRVLGAPFTIRVIGNSRELRSALEMREGIVQKFGLKDLKMILIKETPQLELPAYSHSRVAGGSPTEQQQTAANR